MKNEANPCYYLSCTLAIFAMLNVVMAASVLATEQEFNQDFPHLVFAEDFTPYENGEHPGSIDIFRNSSHRHLHGEVRDQAYAILNEGNRHMLRAPFLRDFVLEFKARADPSTDVAMVLIHFRTDLESRKGYFIFYRWGAKYGVRCSLHARQKYEGLRNKLEVEGQQLPAAQNDTGAWQSFRLVVEGQHFRFYHNNVLQGDWNEEKGLCPEAGRIGFDAGGCSPPFPGPKYLDDIRLYARQPVEETTLWKSKEAELAFFNTDLQAGKIGIQLACKRRGPMELLSANLTMAAAEADNPRAKQAACRALFECMDNRGRVITRRCLEVTPTAACQNEIALAHTPEQTLLRCCFFAGKRAPLWLEHGADWICVSPARHWISLPGMFVDGIALALSGIEPLPSGPALPWPAGKPISLQLHAATFAAPNAAMACRWSLLQQGNGRVIQTGVAVPSTWKGSGALQKLGLHPIQFMIACEVPPPGTYLLQVETWMDERTRRNDEIPVVVGIITPTSLKDRPPANKVENITTIQADRLEIERQCEWN